MDLKYFPGELHIELFEIRMLLIYIEQIVYGLLNGFLSIVKLYLWII